MIDPQHEFEYEQKCEHIALQIEMFVLDRIIAALQRLQSNLEPDEVHTPKTSDNTELF